MLSIKNFSKSYSGEKILSIDLLEFVNGVYWVQGENGAGKTTLFRSLAGLHPCEGQIQFSDDIDLHKDPIEFRRRVNYSEAEPRFPEFLSPKDLIRFVGKARNSDKVQQQHLTELFGVHQFFEKPCGTFSSGMLKKLSLVLAFLGAPRIIILDEPFITLDALAREVLLSSMKQLLDTQKIVFLVSSHQSFESPLIRIEETFLIRDKMIKRID